MSNIEFDKVSPIEAFLIIGGDILSYHWERLLPDNPKEAISSRLRLIAIQDRAEHGGSRRIEPTNQDEELARVQGGVIRLIHSRFTSRPTQ